MTMWQLWRQDDIGNRFLISTHPRQQDAAERLVAFESGHPHKQHYWITSIDDADEDEGPALSTTASGT